MEGDTGHMGGLINPLAPGVDNTELVFQIPVGLPSLERGRHDKKSTHKQLYITYITRTSSPLRPESVMILHN